MSNLLQQNRYASTDAQNYSAAQLELIKTTFAKELNVVEFDLFVAIAKRYRLDPFKKQITAVVFNKNNPNKRRVSFISTIDGARAIAARSGNYRPDEKQPVFTYCEKDPLKNPRGLESASVTVWKQDNLGTWHAVNGYADWEEFAPLKDEWKEDKMTGESSKTGRMVLDIGSNWPRMPKVMLAKCAEMQALRKGWPEDLGNIYLAEEMEQVEAMTASEVIASGKEERLQQRLAPKDSYPVQWNAGDAIEMVAHSAFFDQTIRHVEGMEYETQLNAFMEINRNSFRHFFTKDKHAGLELKAFIEKKREKLILESLEGIELTEEGEES